MATMIEVLAAVDSWLKKEKQSPLTPFEIEYLVAGVVELLKARQIENPKGLEREVNLCIVVGVSKLRHYPVPSYML